MEDRQVNLNFENVQQVVDQVNQLPGPKVKFVNPELGYGLFAERDYEANEFVTEYGGVEGPYNAEGDYVVQVTKRKTLDSEYKFKLSEKGRWINHKNFKQNINVEMQYRNKKAYFVTIKKVKKGEQFKWFYGNDYKFTTFLDRLNSVNETILFMIEKVEAKNQLQKSIIEDDIEILEFEKQYNIFADRSSINASFKFDLF